MQCPAPWLHYLVVLLAGVLLVAGHNGCLNRAENTFCKCSSRGSLLIPRNACLQQFTTNRRWTKVCCSHPLYAAYLNTKAALLAAYYPCGRRKQLPMGLRIHGAAPVIEGEFPWMAILESKPRGQLCAGTLIHPQYVLTVAHCTTNSRKLKVLLGVHKWYPGVDKRDSKVQVIPVENVIRHPNFRETDAALLRLLHPAELKEGVVEPICLPLTNVQIWHLPNKLTIAGWGATETSYNYDGKSRHLMSADVTVLRNVSNHCLQDWDFCAGQDDEGGSCVGDSGGPYQHEHENSPGKGVSHFVLYGIIRSGTVNCRNQDTSSKAVLVAYLMPWLLEEMQIEGPRLEGSESGEEKPSSNEPSSYDDAETYYSYELDERKPSSHESMKRKPSPYDSDEQTNEEY